MANVGYEGGNIFINILKNLEKVFLSRQIKKKMLKSSTYRMHIKEVRISFLVLILGPREMRLNFELIQPANNRNIILSENLPHLLFTKP